MINVRELDELISLPGIKVAIILRTVQTLSKEPREDRGLFITHNDITDIFGVLGEHHIIRNAVNSRKPTTKKESFFDIIHPVCNRSDFFIDTIRFLGEKNDITEFMTMHHKFF